MAARMQRRTQFVAKAERYTDVAVARTFAKPPLGSEIKAVGCRPRGGKSCKFIDVVLQEFVGDKERRCLFRNCVNQRAGKQ